MQRRSLKTSIAVLLSVLSLIFTGCDWDGHIYLDDNTNNTGSKEIDTNDAHSSDTGTTDTNNIDADTIDTSTASPSDDSEWPNDTDPIWTRDPLTVDVFAPYTPRDFFPDKLCVYLIPEEQVIREGLSFSSDYQASECKTDFKIGPDDRTRFFFDENELQSVDWPVFATATLYVQQNNEDSDVFDLGEDYWGATRGPLTAGFGDGKIDYVFIDIYFFR